VRVATLLRPAAVRGRARRSLLAAGVPLLTVLTGLLAGAVALAGPAAAADDPTRPDSRVTHGPSCRPGGVAVEVTAGTVAYAVTLATTRAPGGEDSAELQPGQVAVLRTGEVAWGETIDSRLEFTALDGSGTTYVDELAAFDFTRPAEADCAAIAPPPGTGEVPSAAPSSPAPAGPGEAVPALPDPGGTVPQDAAPPDADHPDTPSDAAPDPVPPGAGDPGTAPLPEVVPVPGPLDDGGSSPGGAVVASADSVAAGDLVTLTGAGFEPGEPVTVRLADGGVLATVPAGPDGEVEVTVRVPGAAGTATLELVGEDSAVTAAVELRVAAAATPVDRDPVPVPLVAAGLALVVTATGLVLTAGRRREPADPTGSA
jgi:hypothetical protein